MPRVSRDGLRLHYEVHGAGPPVLLAHSFLCSGEMWREQVPRLARSYRVVTIDLRGHGRSDAAAGPFTLYDLVDDALAVLDEAGIERAAWAGLSVGGMMALRAALVAPARVSALLVFDSDAGPETGWTRAQHRLLGAVARAVGVRPVIGSVLRQMFGATTRRQRPDLVDEWRERFLAAHVPSMLRFLRLLDTRDDVTLQLPNVGTPALVLVGGEDRALPPSRSRRIAAALPDARYVEIPGAGHLSALERPEVVTAAMEAFLVDHLAGER